MYGIQTYRLYSDVHALDRAFDVGELPDALGHMHTFLSPPNVIGC
jgi:hypothetical protein